MSHGSNPDEFVGSFNDHYHIFRNINRFVDGPNNRAEFYLVSTDREAIGNVAYFYD